MKIKIIAEIGLNHNGNFKLGKQLIDAAKETGADYVKFQLRNMNTLYRNGDLNSEDLSVQYTLDILKKYYLPDHLLFELFDYAKKINIKPLCTPWDIESVNKLNEYGMNTYKIASADLTNLTLLTYVANLKKKMYCSTGMSNEEDIIIACKTLNDCQADYNLLHCNSTYPTPFKDVNLNYMETLRKISCRPVGYSGHERGIAIPIAAAAL